MKRLDIEQKNRLNKVLKNCGIILLIGVLYFIFIKIVGFGIPCIFNLITGLHCPGCGISRMLLSLARLDFAAAFKYNALVLTASPIAAIFVIKHYVRYILTGKSQGNKLETVMLLILLILLIIFGVLRNLPAFSFLAP